MAFPLLTRNEYKVFRVQDIFFGITPEIFPMFTEFFEKEKQEKNVEHQLDNKDFFWIDENPQLFALLLKVIKEGNAAIPVDEKIIEDLLQMALRLQLETISTTIMYYMAGRNDILESCRLLEKVQFVFTDGTLFMKKSAVLGTDSLFKKVFLNSESYQNGQPYIPTSTTSAVLMIQFLENHRIEVPNTFSMFFKLEKYAYYYHIEKLVSICAAKKTELALRETRKPASSYLDDDNVLVNTLTEYPQSYVPAVANLENESLIKFITLDGTVKTLLMEWLNTLPVTKNILLSLPLCYHCSTRLIECTDKQFNIIASCIGGTFVVLEPKHVIYQSKPIEKALKLEGLLEYALNYCCQTENFLTNDTGHSNTSLPNGEPSTSSRIDTTCNLEIYDDYCSEDDYLLQLYTRSGTIRTLPMLLLNQYPATKNVLLALPFSYNYKRYLNCTDRQFNQIVSLMTKTANLSVYDFHQVKRIVNFLELDGHVERNSVKAKSKVFSSTDAIPLTYSIVNSSKTAPKATVEVEEHKQMVRVKLNDGSFETINQHLLSNFKHVEQIVKDQPIDTITGAYILNYTLSQFNSLMCALRNGPVLGSTENNEDMTVPRFEQLRRELEILELARNAIFPSIEDSDSLRSVLANRHYSFGPYRSPQVRFLMCDGHIGCIEQRFLSARKTVEKVLRALPVDAATGAYKINAGAIYLEKLTALLKFDRKPTIKGTNMTDQRFLDAFIMELSILRFTQFVHYATQIANDPVLALQYFRSTYVETPLPRVPVSNQLSCSSVLGKRQVQSTQCNNCGTEQQCKKKCRK